MFPRFRQSLEHTDRPPAVNAESRILSDNDTALHELLESVRMAEQQQIIDDMRNYQEELTREVAQLELRGGVYDSLNRLVEVEKDINELRLAFLQTRNGKKRQAEQIMEQRPDIGRGSALSLARLMAKHRTARSRSERDYAVVHAIDAVWADSHPITQGWRLRRIGSLGLHYVIVNEMRIDGEQREVVEYRVYRGFDPEDIDIKSADENAASEDEIYFVIGIIEATVQQLEQRREFWSQSPRKINQGLRDDVVDNKY